MCNRLDPGSSVGDWWVCRNPQLSDTAVPSLASGQAHRVPPSCTQPHRQLGDQAFVRSDTRQVARLKYILGIARAHVAARLRFGRWKIHGRMLRKVCNSSGRGVGDDGAQRRGEEEGDTVQIPCTQRETERWTERDRRTQAEQARAVLQGAKKRGGEGRGGEGRGRGCARVHATSRDARCHLGASRTCCASRAPRRACPPSPPRW